MFVSALKPRHSVAGDQRIGSEAFTAFGRTGFEPVLM